LKVRLGLLSLQHNVLHWLHIPAHINYKLNVTLQRALLLSGESPEVPCRQLHTSFGSHQQQSTTMLS